MNDDEAMFLACLLAVGPPPEGYQSNASIGVFSLIDGTEYNHVWYGELVDWYRTYYPLKGQTALAKQYDWEHRFLVWANNYAR